MNNVKPLYDGYTTYLTAAVLFANVPEKDDLRVRRKSYLVLQGLLHFPIWKREEKTLGTRLPKIKPTQWLIINITLRCSIHYSAPLTFLRDFLLDY